MGQRSLSIDEDGPISLDHDIHNKRKLAIFESKNSVSPTVNSAIYHVLRGSQTQSFDSEDFDSSLNEVPIFEEEIYKHKPGLRVDTFQPKWIRLTNKKLYIFKDQYSGKYI